MPLPGRKRASLALLLVLAAGLALAAGAAAAAAQAMSCCPPALESERGCTWLGASDCCPERPAAATAVNATPPAPSACASVTPLGVSFAPAALSRAAPAPASRVSSLVLRL
jgi:hypothetical protein